MDAATGPVGLRRMDDLATLARRVVAAGIAVCAPVMAAVWFSDGAQDPWVRWGFPPLGAMLLAFGWVLVRRPQWAVRAAVSALVVLESWWLLMAAGRISESPDAASAWVALLPTPLLDVAVCLVVGFLFQRTRTAVIHGSVYAGLVTVVVSVALAGRPGGDAFVWLAVRYGVYLGVFLVLLLALSRAKEHVTSAVADAARADAAASRMREMAYLDELTGLANRRRLLDELAHQAGRVGQARPVCVVYFDLDHFKQVNDTHGHEFGDQVLRGVAEIASNTVRDGDLVARLGGEEFVLVAPGTGREEAVRLAERLRVALPAGLETTVGVRLTASFGVVELRADEPAEDVLRRVDELMYLAKAEGRDRVQAGR